MRPAEVVRKLRKFHGAGGFFNGRQDPFRVLVATILSQRTRGSNTREAEKRLFACFSTPAEVARAPRRKIERLIRPAGFYRAKARHIQETARAIVERFAGRVPRDLPRLMTLPGVGRKTANCVLVYAFGKAAIPVDIHVHRVANRLGWVETKTPEQTEQELCKLLPRRMWLQVNELLVRHGRTICLPRRPRCNRCPVERWCAKRLES